MAGPVIQVKCPYCSCLLPSGETICPACQEDLSALVKLAYQYVILYNEGLVLARQGRLTAARDSLLQSMALAPEFAPSHIVLAKVYVHLGDWPSALEMAERAYALEPGTETNALRQAIAAHILTPTMRAERVEPVQEAEQHDAQWWKRKLKGQI